uniref:DUF7032 domain-containing protein n=1 Tax=Kalanchoe fedtschenkoi TaxID=63787 RepID=A0A7N0T012_KALFE
MKVSTNDHVGLPTDLLSQFTDEVLKVCSFKGKWSSVKSKLAHLQTHLTDLTDFPNFASNPLFLELVQSVTGTLEDGLALARRCQSDDFKEGKLRTQNDIDSIIARLGRHIRDGEILIKSGVLQDGGVVGSSKREALRVDARNLVTRLQMGCAESKNVAIDSLLGLLMEDDKNVLVAIAQGAVPVLVKLLDSSSAQMKEKTVYAISRVSMVESSKHVLIAEGLTLLNHLIRVLESGSGFAKEKACVALLGLSESKENARAIGSRCGVSSLLEICHTGTPNSQAVAAGVLRNLAIGEIKENFMDENALPVLLGLLASGTSLAQENVIGCLRNLVAGDEELKLGLAREGGIERLKSFWDGTPTAQNLEMAVDLLGTLASCAPTAEAIVAEGFIPRLVVVLNCEVSGVRIAAAKAVNELGFNSKTRKDLGDCGCIPLLVTMLEKKAVDEKEAAAKALSNLIQCTSNKKIFKKDERGIVNVVQLLDPLVPNLDKRYPVSILASLVHSKKCRKLMVAAGASPLLQKLVGMDVEGSKKLFESIRHGKVWGILARP